MSGSSHHAPIKAARKSSLVLLSLWLLASCAGKPREEIILLDAEMIGSLQVSSSKGVEQLRTPYSTVGISQSGSMKSRAISAAEVQQRFGAVLAMLPPASRKYTFHFETGQASFLASEKTSVEVLLEDVRSHPAVEVEITGHTDAVGRSEDNDRLSLDRAEVVKRLLLSAGLVANFIRTRGQGSRFMAMPSEGAEAQNRRVEVIVR